MFISAVVGGVAGGVAGIVLVVFDYQLLFPLYGMLFAILGGPVLGAIIGIIVAPIWVEDKKRLRKIIRICATAGAVIPAPFFLAYSAAYFVGLIIFYA